MFADISAQLSELGVLFDKTLHIWNGRNWGRGVGDRTRLILLDIILQWSSKFSKSREVMCLEERVCACCQCDFLIIQRAHEPWSNEWSTIQPTDSSGRMSGTLLKSTLPFWIPRSSCTIAWYVHWDNNGVTGSFRLSRISRSGETWVGVKSNKDDSDRMRC